MFRLPREGDELVAIDVGDASEDRCKEVVEVAAGEVEATWAVFCGGEITGDEGEVV